MDTFDIITLVNHNGVPLRTLYEGVEWVLEERVGSTNRLEITIPLETSVGILTDQELLFRGKRYVISEVVRSRNSRRVDVFADEAQVELSFRNIKTFTLNDTTLETAMKRALNGTAWTVKAFMNTTHHFYATIEDKSAMYCISFLASQLGATLVFDSVNRQVSIVDLAEKEINYSFRYGVNMDDISKTELQPEATVIYPFGKDGMTIESLNGGLNYLEDYSWYTQLGIPIAEARKRFKKEFVWSDERFIYVGNLLTAAKDKLAIMSHPKLNYTIKTAGHSVEDAVLNEKVYVVDEELGIRIKTTVVRKRISKSKSGDEIELDYLPASLTDTIAENSLADSSGSQSGEAIFLLKNKEALTLSSIYTPAIQSSITVISSTFFQAGITVPINVTTAGTLDIYFMLAGNMLPTRIRQTLSVGWHTIGIPFVITQVPEGIKSLDCYVAMTDGAGTIEKEAMELFILAKGALGGDRNERPDRRVSDDVEMPVVVGITDGAIVSQKKPMSVKVSDSVVMAEIISITDQADTLLE